MSGVALSDMLDAATDLLPLFTAIVGFGVGFLLKIYWRTDD